MLEVCLLGTGGTMPLPGRPLTALLARCAGKSLLIDCGEGTQVRIREAGWSMAGLDMILLTHFHGDHVLGLPGLLLSMARDGRLEPVEIVGAAGLSGLMAAMCAPLPPLPFPVRCRELTQGEETLTLGAMNVDAFPVEHGMPCYGYRLRVDRAGRFRPEKARALGVEARLWGALQRGAPVETERGTVVPDMVMGPRRRGIRAVYCTDTRPNPRLAAYAEGADLLICEGMYGDEAKLCKAVENGHMMIREAAELARDAGAGEMWLTHFSPSMTSPEPYLAGARAIFPDVSAPDTPFLRDLQYKN